MAYFDNAATTYPKPECVYTFMDSFYRGNGGNAGRGEYSLAKTSSALIAETRDKIRTLLHCPAKQVIFTPTATIALNMLIHGIIAMGAHEIYISPFEHNAVTRTLHHYEVADSIHVHVLATNSNMSVNMEKIRYQFDSVAPDAIIISHASNVFGVVSPVELIFELAKKYEAITVVDMAQTAGLIDFNAGASFLDFAVFAGHKTLYGPTGISGIVMNPEINLPPELIGGTGYESANQNMPESLPEKYEMGTLNIAGVAGLHAALLWIESTTISKIATKEQENRERLIRILSEYPWLHVIGNYAENKYIGVISCIIDGISSDSAGPIFDNLRISVRTGLQCAPLAHKFMNTYPAGTIRFSVSYFTSDADFEELIAALNEIDAEL